MSRYHQDKIKLSSNEVMRPDTKKSAFGCYGVIPITADVVCRCSLMSNDVEATGHAKLIHRRAPQQWEGRRYDQSCKAFGACAYRSVCEGGDTEIQIRDSPVTLSVPEEPPRQEASPKSLSRN